MATESETEDIEVRLVLEAIFAKYGYDLRQYSPASMRRRVLSAAAVSGAAHLGELQHRLLSDRNFFAGVLEQLTVQVSETFRDPEFYKTFRTEVVPLLRTYPQVKIWHAGCAGGEEVYSTAILLREENLYDRAMIYATDISVAALNRARDGVYTEAQAAVFAENYARSGGTRSFDDYHSRAYGRIAMNAELRTNMVFFQHNLATDYALGEMHVVFCRNVLLYFAPPLRERVIDVFSRSLPPGGFLCLGASERLPDASPFEEFAGDARIYRFKGAR